jgi:hypothetical protein
MSERMREQLAAGEEEWKILEPRIQKVQQLQRNQGGVFRGFGGAWGGFGRGGRRFRDRTPADDAPPREPSEIEKKSEALTALLDDEASRAGAINAALEAYRGTKRKAQVELATARKDLREVVTLRQEGRLVLMGILD